MGSNPSSKVVRLLNREAIYLPLVHELFLKALARGALNPELSIRWVWEHLNDPQVGAFVGLDAGGLPATLVVMILPYNPQTSRPLLDMWAGNGDFALTRATIAAGLDFARAAGYAKFWCFNFSDHSDAAYLRAMRCYFGQEGRKRATMLEMDLDGRVDTKR